MFFKVNPFSRTQFIGKTVLITGATSGIGEALAWEFANKGAQVILLARRVERLKEISEKLKFQGKKSRYFACDVTKEADIETVVKTLIQERIPIDVVVANAGFGVVGMLDKLKLTDFYRQFETNTFGVLRTLKLTLGEVKKTRGRFVVIGSVNGYVAVAGLPAYSMSKFAIRGLCDSLALELREEGVSVTHIAPGFVTSEIRQVNNQGQYLSERKDPTPKWIRMPAPLAAKKIVRATFLRKPERIITAHGYWAVWLNRYFPRICHFVLHAFRIRALGKG